MNMIPTRCAGFVLTFNFLLFLLTQVKTPIECDDKETTHHRIVTILSYRFL